MTTREVGEYRPYTGISGGNPPRKPTVNLQKIVGAGLAGVGAIFILYGAGSGVSKLIEVSLNNFGLVFFTISFIFWTAVCFPLGGCIVNGGAAMGLIGLFSGIPAMPGLAIMGVGAFVYYTAR
jgi:hypothetical protein